MVNIFFIIQYCSIVNFKYFRYSSSFWMYDFCLGFGGGFQDSTPTSYSVRTQVTYRGRGVRLCPWTIMGNILIGPRSLHTKTSFADFEKEYANSNRHKRLIVSSQPNFACFFSGSQKLLTQLIHPSLFSILFLYIIELGIVLTIAEIMLVWRYAITNQSIQLFPCPQCPGRWFTPGTPVSSTKKIGRHDITEILLKVALKTINRTSMSVLFFKVNTTNLTYFHSLILPFVLVFLDGCMMNNMCKEVIIKKYYSTL